MAVINCGHPEEEQRGWVCAHLLENLYQDNYLRFTGVGAAFWLLCASCWQQPEEARAAHLREVCQDCARDAAIGGRRAAMAGLPAIKERPSALAFAHETIKLSGPLAERVLDIQPIDTQETPVWVALTASGALVSIDLARRLATPLAQLPAHSVDLDEAVSLHLARAGSLAAVVNTRGQRGVVIDLATGRATMRLERGNYHVKHCVFSVAFFEQDGRLLLVHATTWNRLDVSDPRTGQLLTKRRVPAYQGGQRPAHYLDYFHCGLSISPSQEWIADNGWLWHPMGMVVSWNLRRWVQENAWESEDGPTKKDLCWRDHYWDGPLCWLDGQTLAVWGEGEDDLLLIPAVRLFDVSTGQELRQFRGPAGTLVYDGYLFSFAAEQGMAVWDVATGERLLHEPAWCPLRYHRGACQFLTLLPDGAFQLSRLVERASG
jgi:hypothetical protein